MTVTRTARRARALPLLLALVAGCGSTVASSGTAATTGPAGEPLDGLQSGAIGGDNSAAGLVAGEGAAAAAAGDGRNTSSGAGPSAVGVLRGSSSGGQSAAGVAPVAPRGGGSGPGVTDKEIYVGLVYQVNGEALNSAAGANGISTGDSQRNTRIIIDDINRRGGIGGRKLVPVYAKFDATSTQTVDQQWAAICAKFTQDEPRVFAVDGAGVESYRACIAKAGVLHLNAGLPTLGAAEFARYPGFVELGYPNIDRLAAYHVQPLQAQGYFSPWDTVNGRPAAAGKAKVGILTYSDRVFSGAVDKYLVPALRRLGYEPQVARISSVNTASDYGEQSAAVKSAQLSFAANGVTHVIPFEANAGLSLFFLANARSQGYYPRYGISSASGFQVLLDIGSASAQQVRGTVGFGWLPQLDLRAVDNPDDGKYSNAERRYCLELLRRNGVTYDNANAAAVALSDCAVLRLLDRAVDATPARVTRATAVAAIENLGRSYQPAGGLGLEFRPGRRDPVDRAYHWRFFDDCTCFRYSGGLQVVP